MHFPEASKRTRPCCPERSSSGSPKHRALVPADVIDGSPGGGLCLSPDSWLAEGVSAEAQRDALLPLLDLPVELVLVSHGEPVLSDGHAALAQALAV